ncbi:hypothetical protein [Nannocystis sp. SCPEA4]|uniref:hypothetical protein n=1 Tax=Nannocystis sp. SCPEA4 TaxID=2996787 RepID=UPI0022718DCC|nr:hypothetical protein [Nannocystis sp. SCPEA4]MCY1054594.1 hypothetical protein [Nannocystis sp. SCPEA4]
MPFRRISILALLALLLPGCPGPRGPAVIKPGGANPCDSCAKGEFCNWSTGDDPECVDRGCEEIPQRCAPCFGAPSRCDAEALDYCMSLDELCYLADFEGAELADDGTVVVYCSEINDTGCET